MFFFFLLSERFHNSSFVAVSPMINVVPRKIIFHVGFYEKLRGNEDRMKTSIEAQGKCRRRDPTAAIKRPLVCVRSNASSNEIKYELPLERDVEIIEMIRYRR